MRTRAPPTGWLSKFQAMFSLSASSPSSAEKDISVKKSCWSCGCFFPTEFIMYIMVNDTRILFNIIIHQYCHQFTNFLFIRCSSETYVRIQGQLYQYLENMKQKEDLERIYETSSPEASCKGQESPRKIVRGRVMANAMGDSYLTFFKIDSKNDMSQLEASSNIKKIVQNQETLEQKNNRIQVLQETITKETSKQRAREKAFERRIKQDWKNDIFQILVRLVQSCSILSKDSLTHKRKALEVVVKMCRAEHKIKVRILVQWLLEWVQAVFSSLSVQIKNIL